LTFFGSTKRDLTRPKINFKTEKQNFQNNNFANLKITFFENSKIIKNIFLNFENWVPFSPLSPTGQYTPSGQLLQFGYDRI